MLLSSIHSVHRISLTISIRCKGFRVWLRHAWDSLWKSYTQTDWSNKKKCANERANERAGVARDKWQDLVKSVIHNSKSCVWIGACWKCARLVIGAARIFTKAKLFHRIAHAYLAFIRSGKQIEGKFKAEKQARKTEQVEGKSLAESVNTSQHKT